MAADAPPRHERVEIPGVENAFRLGPHLYSGGEPRGETSLAALKALGVRTILSVDGSRPDVETARRLGLRYVHLPIGYDGISREQAVRIVRAAATLPGPVFIHCHHGKHRGPTAAALCEMAQDSWNPDQGRAWLREAGTSVDYRGLFATVADFRKPTAEEWAQAGSTPFPETAATPHLVATMVTIDGRWDRLKASRDAGFRVPPDDPDLDPAREATQLAEDFRELARTDASKARGQAWITDLERSARLSSELAGQLQRFAESTPGSAREEIETTYQAVGRSCTQCHGQRRDHH